MPTRVSNPDTTPDAVLSMPWKQKVRRRLIAWYKKNARDLPWRRSRDPYRVWVSEIMLQQTQVATAAPYFERFVTAFPDVWSLARADESSVLKLWEGLGYYRRARQMHRASRILVEQYAGEFPHDPQIVRKLPGIGRYTAGAILSIAFDAREPILEANTVRLFSRLAAYRQDPTQSEGQRFLWAMAEELLPRQQVGMFNQAVMELGSQVCRAKNPFCPECPLDKLCTARVEGVVDVVPQPKRKVVLEDVQEVAVVVLRHGHVLLRQRGDRERWAGLWDFPRFPITARSGPKLEQLLITEVKNLTGVVSRPIQLLTTLQHGVTRFRITLDCHVAEWVSGRLKVSRRTPMKWIKPAELAEFPLSTTGRKLGRLVVNLAE